MGSLQSVLNAVSERALLREEIARCTDSSVLPVLVERLLGRPCKNLLVDGPVRIAGEERLVVGSAVHLGDGCELWCAGGVELGDCVVCGPGAKIVSEAGKPVVIEQRVWLGAGVEVMPGARIGADAVICAGTRVEREVRERAVIQGSPAEVVRYAR